MNTPLPRKLTSPRWAYQAPSVPSAKPMHRYYRAKYVSMQPLSKSPGAAYLTLFRYAGSSAATLIVEIPNHQIFAPTELDRPSMLALRDALNDALHDIDADLVVMDRTDPSAITAAVVQRANAFILSQTPKGAP